MAVAGFRIGIEIELFLNFKGVFNDISSKEDRSAFAAQLMTIYNQKRDPSMPKLAEDLTGLNKTSARSEWVLTPDNTVEADFPDFEPFCNGNNDVDEAAMDEAAMDEAAMDEAAMDEAAMDEAAMDEAAMYKMLVAHSVSQI
ncbi:hypothetical protein MMC26_001326 [Xylographa opegraphella]|nr:hypothetical protein [Xylographa opegraphella]